MAVVITGPIKVQLYCRELKRYKLYQNFWDSRGVAVGNTYKLNEFGEREHNAKHEWEILRIFPRDDKP